MTLTCRLPVATARAMPGKLPPPGLGRWSVLPAGYDACHNADEVLADFGHDPDADVENPADSVFCSHGAGYLVRWDEVPRPMWTAGLPAAWTTPPGWTPMPPMKTRKYRPTTPAAARPTGARWSRTRELLAIFERTYGKIKRRGPPGADNDGKAARTAMHTRPAPVVTSSAPAKPQPTGPDYLLVDGYNVIFAWDELRKMAETNLDAARRRLMDILCNYAGYKRCVPILVFDAYKVRGGTREVEKHHNLYVVYTQEAETADMYIERTTHELAKDHRTRVVSSDGAEQIIVLGNGALRVSARAFAEEVAAVEKEIREFLQN